LKGVCQQPTHGLKQPRNESQNITIRRHGRYLLRLGKARCNDGRRRKGEESHDGDEHGHHGRRWPDTGAAAAMVLTNRFSLELARIPPPPAATDRPPLALQPMPQGAAVVGYSWCARGGRGREWQPAVSGQYVAVSRGGQRGRGGAAGGGGGGVGAPAIGGASGGRSVRKGEAAGSCRGRRGGPEEGGRGG
jgi:hypothetical protein